MKLTGVRLFTLKQLSMGPELVASQVPLLPDDLKGNSEYFGCGCDVMQPFLDAVSMYFCQVPRTCSMLEPVKATRKMLIQRSETVSESSPQTRVAPNCWVMSRITNQFLSDFRPFNLGNPESLAMMEEARIPRLAKSDGILMS